MSAMANKEEVKGCDTSGFNESADSDRSADTSDLFDLHLSRLSSAKKDLLFQMRAERDVMVNRYEDMMKKARQDFADNELVLKQTIDKLTADYSQSHQKSQQEIDNLQDQLRQSAKELDESRRLVKDLNALVKQKESELDEMKKKREKCDEDLRQMTEQYELRSKDMDSKWSEAESKRESALQQLSSLTEKLKGCDSEIQSLKSSLSLANEKYQILDNKCQTISSENQRIRQSLDFELKAKHESMETIKSLTNSLAENQKEIQRLQKEWSDLERSRISEIKNLRKELNVKEQDLKSEILRLKQDKSVSDKKSVNDINSLIEKLKETDEELHKLKSETEKEKQRLESIISEKNRCFEELMRQKTEIETELTLKVNDLSKQLENSFRQLNEERHESEKTSNNLIQLKTQLIASENEKEVLKTSLLNANEKCYSLEFKIDSLNNEVEKYKHLFGNESKEKMDKTQLIETITDSLRERQSEIERLNKLVKDLDKTCKELESSRNAVMDDCHELRATLMEVEKSRLEIRRELNSNKLSNSSLENKLKSKDLEVQELKKRFESMKEERNSLKNSLDSSIKSLTQLRDMNNTLSQHNKQLSLNEAQHHLNSSPGTMNDRGHSVSILKKDNQSLKDKVNKLESDKKKLERSFNLIEKEKSVLKTTLDDIQRKTSMRLDKTIGDRSDKSEVILDEAKIITQGLAALELKNLELQRKVQGLQSLMNEAEGMNGNDVGHRTNGDNGVHSSDFIKLRMAQKHAEDLIDGREISSNKHTNLDKELSRLSLSPSLTTTPPRFKEPPIRSQSVSRIDSKQQNTDTSTPLPSYSSTSGLQNVKRKLNYKT